MLVAAITDPTVGWEEPHKGGEGLCAHEKWRTEPRSSYPNLAEQKERCPDLLPPPSSSTGPWSADSRPTPPIFHREISAAGEQLGLKLEEDPDAERENQQPRKEGMASLIPRSLTTVVARMATGQGEVWDSQLPGLSLTPQRSERSRAPSLACAARAGRKGRCQASSQDKVRLSLTLRQLLNKIQVPILAPKQPTGFGSSLNSGC